MDFEPALKEELVAITGLTDKVFPLVASSVAVVPYVVYASSEGLRVKDLNGYTGLKQVDTELNAVAGSYSSLKVIESKIIAKLISFQGRVIGTGGPYIKDITYEMPTELYESLPKLYRAVINFTVYFE